MDHDADEAPTRNHIIYYFYFVCKTVLERVPSSIADGRGEGHG